MRRTVILLAALAAAPLLAAQEPAPPPPAPAARRAEPAPKPPALPGARFRGVVLNAEDGTPLPSADVTLLGMDVARRAGDDGRFDFGTLEPGPYIIQARFLGFQPYTIRAELADSSTLDLTIRLKRKVVELEEQTVTAAEQKRGRFYERMAESQGFGTFVTREQIEQRNTPFTCDLLRGRLGMRIIQTGTTCNIRFSRSQGSSFQNADCPPGFFLDGARSDISILENNALPTTTIEGIEIYRSAAEAPMELNQGNTCGVIAIWTRVGR